MQKQWVVFGIALILLSAAGWASGETITIVTEEFPPYNYQDNGKLIGVSTEVVEAVLKQLPEITVEFKVYPWARAYKNALENPNTLIYSLGFNEKRRDLFKWVGVIAPAEFYLFA